MCGLQSIEKNIEDFNNISNKTFKLNNNKIVVNLDEKLIEFYNQLIKSYSQLNNNTKKLKELTIIILQNSGKFDHKKNKIKIAELLNSSNNTITHLENTTKSIDSSKYIKKFINDEFPEYLDDLNELYELTCELIENLELGVKFKEEFNEISTIVQEIHG